MCVMWQMLLPLGIMADVIVIFLFILHQQNMHITVLKADIICLVEDGKSTLVKCFICGRCYCQVADGIPPGWRLADVTSKWQMEWPLFYVIF